MMRANSQEVSKSQPRPIEYGAITQLTSTEENYTARAVEMASSIGKIVREVESYVIAVVETPSNWFNDKGTKSKDAESIQRLYWTVGAIVNQLVMEPVCAEVWTVRPEVWKGQTPKPVMRGRVEAYLKTFGRVLPEEAPDDTSDAVWLAKTAAEKYLTKSGGDSLPDGWWPVYPWNKGKCQVVCY